MKKYIVRDGDTLSTVSEMTGVKVSLLMAANPQLTDSDQLFPGQVLSIPELGKHATPGRSSVPGGNQQLPAPVAPVPVHEVAPAPHEAQAAMPPSPMAQGAMPPSPITGTPAEPGMPTYFGFVWPHVVGAGETWESICTTYGITMEQLHFLNPTVTRRPLYQGDIVYIPYLPKEVRRRQRQALVNQQNHPWSTGAQFPQTPGLYPSYPYPAVTYQQPPVYPYPAPYPLPYPVPEPQWYPAMQRGDWSADWETSPSWESDTDANWYFDTDGQRDTGPTGGTNHGNGAQ